MKNKYFLVALIPTILIAALVFVFSINARSAESVETVNRESTLHGSSNFNGFSNDDRAPDAYHEFVMFGNDRIYLSHYAMFHSVHAYQAIIQTSFEKGNIDVVKTFLEDRRQHPDRFYTLSPSKKDSPDTRRRDDWVLPDYIHEGSEFNADIHWEDHEGQVAFLLQDVTVKIDKVILFRKFEETDQHHDRLTYLLFGEKGDKYLAHFISGMNDFDHIMAVDIENDQLDPNPYSKLIIDGKDEASMRPETGKKYIGEITNSDKQKPTSLTIKPTSEIYFEEIEEQG